MYMSRHHAAWKPGSSSSHANHAAGGGNTPPPPVALITGGSSGIGLCLAKLFAERGFALTLAARSLPSLEAASADVRAAGQHHRPPPTVTVASVDVADVDACGRLVTGAAEQHGQLDVLVVCAGVGHHGLCTADDPGLATHRRMMDINYMGAVGCIQSALPILLAAQPTGRILAVGSLSGEVGLPVRSAYCASKAALSAYLESISRELAMQGTPIAITNVAPSSVDTNFHGKSQRHGPRPSLSAEQCATCTMAAFDAGKSISFIPGYMRLLPLLPRWLSDPAIASQQRSLLGGVTAAEHERELTRARL